MTYTPLKTHINKLEYTIKNDIQICGLYYGHIETKQKELQPSYLDVKKVKTESNTFSIYLIQNVEHRGISEKILIDIDSGIIFSDLLGDGEVLIQENKKIILKSTPKNGKLWYFEK